MQHERQFFTTFDRFALARRLIQLRRRCEPGAAFKKKGTHFSTYFEARQDDPITSTCEGRSACESFRDLNGDFGKHSNVRATRLARTKCRPQRRVVQMSVSRVSRRRRLAGNQFRPGGGAIFASFLMKTWIVQNACLASSGATYVAYSAL